VSCELPGIDAWLEWRAALPAAAGWADVSHLRGPTSQAMRRTLAAVQRQMCALCLTAGKPLMLDHDHETGLARGMLCRSCNGREGRGAYSIPVLRAYRSNPPAAGAGWIWDASGSVARAMLARAKANGDRSGAIPACVPRGQ
jgi:hypothetical protein